MTSTLIFVAIAWVVGWWRLPRVPRLPAAIAVPAPLRTISVIVPARNEAASLPNLLTSLTTQTRPAHEVIVVDDHSTDGTGDLARRSGFATTVVVPPPLPTGWTGKAWACHHGAQRATGDLLCFIDADVTLGVDALARVSAAGPNVSVQPFHEMRRVDERAAAFFNIVAWMGVGTRRGHQRGAFGPLMVCRRADYEATGGHAHPTVRGAVLDDVALSKVLPDQVRVFGSPREVIRFRMYPRGLRQLVEGFTKNIAAGAGQVSPLASLAVFVWITGALVAIKLLASAPYAYAAFALQLWIMLRQLGNFTVVTALLYPVPLLVFLFVFARSAVKIVWRRPVRWKDREVASR